MDLSAYRIDWSTAFARWGDFLADSLAAPRGLFWWPTLMTAALAAALVWALATRSRRAESIGLDASEAPDTAAQSSAGAAPATTLTSFGWRAYLRELPIDLACFAGYTFVMVVFAPWLLLATTAGVVALLWTFHVPGPFLGTPGDGHALLLAAAMFIGGDFGLYWSHRLFHALRPLWVLHALHHAPPVLTPLTAFRFWPPEAFVHFAAFNLGSGLALGAVCLVAGTGIAPATWLGINVFLAAWYLAFSHLRHSPVPLAFPRALSRVLVSPHMHQAHHSDDPSHRDRNFGTALAVWDGMFGTLYLPARGERFRFGAGR